MGMELELKIAFLREIIHVLSFDTKNLIFRKIKICETCSKTFPNAVNAVGIKTNWNSLPMNYSHDSMLLKHAETVGNGFWQSNKLFMTKKE